ncbi:hypothetical protein BC833DRAFT_658907 [Globomyces pollinis-pini]|nr:hypothetical protein BC833DRAFT_658907 [Globomyces pollinis-pini]
MEGNKQIYSCPHPNCHKTYTKHYGYKVHYETIHLGQTYKCSHPGCNLIYSRKYDMLRHMKSHKDTKQFSCQECGKKFGRKEHLQKHASKLYKCQPKRSYKFSLMYIMD